MMPETGVPPESGAKTRRNALSVSGDEERTLPAARRRRWATEQR